MNQKESDPQIVRIADILDLLSKKQIDALLYQDEKVRIMLQSADLSDFVAQPNAISEFLKHLKNSFDFPMFFFKDKEMSIICNLVCWRDAYIHNFQSHWNKFVSKNMNINESDLVPQKPYYSPIIKPIITSLKDVFSCIFYKEIKEVENIFSGDCEYLVQNDLQDFFTSSNGFIHLAHSMFILNASIQNAISNKDSNLSNWLSIAHGVQFILNRGHNQFLYSLYKNLKPSFNPSIQHKSKEQHSETQHLESKKDQSNQLKSHFLSCADFENCILLLTKVEKMVENRPQVKDAVNQCILLLAKSIVLEQESNK